MEVDSILRKKIPVQDSGESHSGTASDGELVTVRRGRVVVKEIGEQTKRGGYHLTLIRYKHYALLQRRMHSTFTFYNTHSMYCPFQIKK